MARYVGDWDGARALSDRILALFPGYSEVLAQRALWSTNWATWNRPRLGAAHLTSISDRNRADFDKG